MTSWKVVMATAWPLTFQTLHVPVAHDDQDVQCGSARRRAGGNSYRTSELFRAPWRCSGRGHELSLPQHLDTHTDTQTETQKHRTQRTDITTHSDTQADSQEQTEADMQTHTHTSNRETDRHLISEMTITQTSINQLSCSMCCRLQIQSDRQSRRTPAFMFSF